MSTLITPIVAEEVETVADVVAEVTTAETEVVEVAETVAEATAEAVAPSTEIAEAQTKDVAAPTPAANRMNIAAFEQAQAEAGFEGMALDAFSFERVSLKEGQFILGEDTELGKKMTVQCLTARPVFIVRQSDSDDAEIFYSYDKSGQTLMDGSPATEILNEWLELGYGTVDTPLDIKEYREVTAEILSTESGSEDVVGTVVNMSLPPSAISRYAGAAAIAARKFGVTLDHVELECAVGAQVSGKGTTKFRPWTFRALRRI